MSQPQESFSAKLFEKLQWIEIALWAGAGIGLLLRFASVPSNNLIIISLSGLAIILFLSAYRPPNIVRSDDEKLGFTDLLCFSIAPKVLGISSAVTIIGVLFFLMGMKGYEQMLLVGSMSIAIASLLIEAGVVMKVKHMKTVISILYRAVPLMLIGFYLLWL
jgi:hypothetical protein